MTATMMDILFNGVGWTDIALTLNRVAVGIFFLLSGYHKLFNAQRHVSLVEELKELAFLQWALTNGGFQQSSSRAVPVSPLGSLHRSPRLAFL